MYVELVVWVTDEDNVVAGPIAAGLFVLLILAVVFLGFSLTKRLRNAERAEAAGLYDPSTKKKRTELSERAEPTDPAGPTEPTEPTE